MIIASLDAYRRQVDPGAQPGTYYLRLKDASKAGELRKEWLEAFQGLINVSVIQDDPVTSIVQLKNLIVSMAAILLLVATANLLSASLLSVRERVRDIGIQKTLGLTPTQIGVSVVVSALTISLIALLIGVTLGLALTVRFIQQVGIAIGAGPDFYPIHWSGILMLLPLLLIVAAASSLLPALRAARLEIAEALHYE